MYPMPHAYTNRTIGDGRIVIKRYEGPEATKRRNRELLILGRLHGLFPVPPVVAAEGENSLTLRFMPGSHGQDLIQAGKPAHVMRALGTVLRSLHRLDVGRVGVDLPRKAGGTVLVHGDFGPNNVLIDPNEPIVTALLDWEWAHIGDPLEDLTWCEWIARAVNTSAVPYLGEMYAAYSRKIPDWQVRKAAMVTRCQEVVEFTRAWEPDSPRLEQRKAQLEATKAWKE